MNKITKITLSLCAIGALSSLSALEFQSIWYNSHSLFEAAGEMSSKTNTISGSNVPAYAKGTLSLVSTF